MSLHLAPDELTVWEGAPPHGLRFGPQDLFAVPFSVLWLAAVSSGLFVTASGRATQVDPITFLILPFFALIGLYMVFGRFLVDMAIRKGTRYVLTNRRALIESGLFRKQLRSINLGYTPEINFRIARKGRGTIEFGSTAGPFAMFPRSWPGAARFLAPAIEGIDEAEHVYSLALEMQQNLQRR